MRWVLDVIDHNRTFERDPFYTAQVLSAFDAETYRTYSFEDLDLPSFNGSETCHKITFPLNHFETVRTIENHSEARAVYGCVGWGHCIFKLSAVLMCHVTLPRFS